MERHELAVGFDSRQAQEQGFRHSNSGRMGQKEFFFQKQTVEVIDYKEKWSGNEPERTEKQSGEVIENIRVHKKRTETNRKTNRAMLLKTQAG